MKGYTAVLKLLALRHQQNQNGSMGVVRLISITPFPVPAVSTTVVDGFADFKMHSSNTRFHLYQVGCASKAV